MGKSGFILLIQIILFNLICNGQKSFNNLNFKYLTIEDGLISNRVRCIFRDSKDYLWIGTDNGLNRYDGSKLEVFTNDPEDKSSLTNNYVLCSFEDKSGNLWFGTNGGLNRFDRKTKTFKHYLPDSLLICGILQDKYENVWVATSSGFNRYNPVTDDFKQYYFLNKKSAESNYITSFCYDSDNTLWFGSGDNALWSFKIEEEVFEKHTDGILTPTLSTDKQVAFADNNVWIGTIGYGLFVYNTKSNMFKKVPISKNGKGISGKDIKSLSIDSNQYLLIGVDQGGVDRLDLKTNNVEYCTHNKLNEKSLNNDGVWCVYKDIEGILYIGTSAGGLNIYNPKEDLFTKYQHQENKNNSLIYNSVFCFYEDSKGLIWIGTDGGGLSVFNPNTQVFQNYVSDPEDSTTISGNAVLCIGEDKNHDIWLGTWGAGLNKFNRKTGKFTHFHASANNPYSITSNNVWDLTFDDRNQMWVTYLSNSMVDIFEIKNGGIERLPDQIASMGMLNTVRGIKNFGSELGFFTNKGYFTWQNETKSFKKLQELGNGSLNDVILDSKENFWFCTNENGLVKMASDHTIEKFGKKDGLPDRIASVIEDENNDIWIMSNNGLSKFDVKLKEFSHNYLSYKNNTTNFAISNALKASDGTIYVGGYSGFYTFRPNKIVQNKYIPSVYINEFRLANKLVTINTPDTPLKQVIEETNEIVLSYSNASFSFGFNAINYTNPQKARFAYKLDGYDKDWIYTTSDRKFTSYTKPDPGVYTFMVKASNNDGVWNENPKSIRIIIRPPFWQQWWFRIAITMLIFGSILSFYFWRINNLKRQHKVLEQAVWKRTSELRLVNSELNESKEEVLLKNIAIEKQNIELDIANQTKNKLFSIVAHDLKNPFNTILGFISILIDDFDELNNEEKRNYLTIIQGSSQSAYNLVENLLNWARTQTNTIKLQFQKINVREMIDANVQLVKIFGEIKSISIAFKEVDERHNVYADKNMIDTVLRNLLTNAIKFSKKDSLVQISSVQRGNFIEIHIRDQGVGMTNEQIEKLFTIDENRSTQGTSGETGTGLGVIICKEFVERNKGEISVTSKEGEGSTFVITLPGADTVII